MKTSSTTTILLLLLVSLSLFSLPASAADPDPVQDFCVSANETEISVFVNGNICKDPKTVTADDFYYSGGLHEPQPIDHPLGTSITQVNERHIRGLNTQGLSLSRIDFNPRGLNAPHIHPRSSQMILAMEGTIYAGFITTNPVNFTDNSTLFAKVLNPGDMFVFPRGLIHFNFNLSYDKKAVALVFFNSQNPGVSTLGRALFGVQPPVYPPVLAGGFQIDEELVEYLQSLEWLGN